MTIKDFKIDSQGITLKINDSEPQKGVYLIEKNSEGICYGKTEFDKKNNKYYLSWDSIIPNLVNNSCKIYIMSCDYLSGELEDLSCLKDNHSKSLIIPTDNSVIYKVKINAYIQNHEILINVDIEYNTEIYVKSIEQYPEYIDFIFDKSLSNYEFYLAKRQTLEHNGKYSIKILTPCIDTNNKCVVRIYKNNGFNGLCRSGGEIWDLLLKARNRIFINCKTKAPYSYDYYDESERIQIKPFASNNIYLAFWTKLKNSLDKKINVAVWGSCYTREVFHSINYLNIDYKNWYEVVYTAFHHSIISAVSKPLNINIEKRDSGNNYKLINMYADSEFNKSTFDAIGKCKPDYLIMDLFTEANCPIYKLEDEIYISDAFYLLETAEFKSLKKVNKITIYDTLRYELFKSSVKEFRKRMLQINFPLDRIILVSCRPAMQKSIGGKIIDWENQPWLKMSCELWDRNDEYFLSVIPEAKHIEMRDFIGITLDTSPLTMSTNHLQSQYYKEVLNRINKIVLSDLLK